MKTFSIVPAICTAVLLLNSCTVSSNEILTDATFYPKGFQAEKGVKYEVDTSYLIRGSCLVYGDTNKLNLEAAVRDALNKSGAVGIANMKITAVIQLVGVGYKVEGNPVVRQPSY